jgi:hypothetical protein
MPDISKSGTSPWPRSATRMSRPSTRTVRGDHSEVAVEDPMNASV